MADNPINLASLQQQDPYISKILAMATQVQLYSYNKSIKNEWEKTDMSGPLFVYMRSACPIHGMIILNKQSLENWVEPITDQLEFQIQTPFLLYRCGRRIQGIWFYKPTECEEVGELMQKLQEEAVKSKQSSAADAAHCKVTRPGGQKNVDIMQILSGAQQRYESKTKGGPEPQNMDSSSSTASGPQLIKPTPVKLPGESGPSVGLASGSVAMGGDGPSQLQELFKNVKLTQQLQQRPGGMVDQYTGDPPPDVTINPLHRSLSVTEVESGAQARAPVPVSLVSTGGLTVEEIERQQREQIHSADSLVAGPTPPSQGAEAGMSQSPSTKELLNLIVAAASSGDGQGGSLPAMPQLQPNPTGDGGVKGTTATLMTPGDFEKHPPPQSAPKDSSSGGVGAVCPDVLLTPMAFAAPRSTSSNTPPPSALNHAALLEQLNNLRRHSPASSSVVSPPPPEVSPLTKQQLQQALIHILRTDEDFISRVHEAYLVSFQQQLAATGSGKR
ncbi:mRNA-decapping enzyme 1A-like [Babylonia areolata]|uniref:mRNA-decapping enzyme 1A-like n=1 Tax=Babylonia areolata TaxID=304850 RepID=UPI003FD1B9FE